MKCPKDNSQMTIKSKEGIVGHSCSDCNGIFLEGKGVQAFKHNYDSKILEVSLFAETSKSPIINCPQCKNDMQIADIDSIEIDVCNHCKGIWFDEQEISTIIETYGKKQSNASTFDFFDIIFEFFQF